MTMQDLIQKIEEGSLSDAQINSLTNALENSTALPVKTKKPHYITSVVPIKYSYTCLLCASSWEIEDEIDIIHKKTFHPSEDTLHFDVHHCSNCTTILTQLSKENIISSCLTIIKSLINKPSKY